VSKAGYMKRRTVTAVILRTTAFTLVILVKTMLATLRIAVTSMLSLASQKFTRSLIISLPELAILANICSCDVSPFYGVR
jgi:hypothetical protein